MYNRSMNSQQFRLKKFETLNAVSYTYHVNARNKLLENKITTFLIYETSNGTDLMMAKNSNKLY